MNNMRDSHSSWNSGKRYFIRGCP